VCSLYNYGRLLDYVWNNPDKAELMYRRALLADPKHVPSLRLSLNRALIEPE
jgi:hypothetical protein